MHVWTRWLGIVAVIASTAGVVWQATSTDAVADGRHVTIKDNEALSPQVGFDPRQGRWQFNPTTIEVTRGEPIVFESPPSNHDPHTVTNLARTSSPVTVPVSFIAGNIFDSGFIQPGASWTLDTGGLTPGNYAYVCRLHPWMNGEITVK